MKFDKIINKLLEDFNVFPRAQGAPSTGPDQGMTQGDNVNTFPSSMSSIRVKLPNKRAKKKKDHPKETLSTRRS